jgi:predicted transcriptional regulator
MPMTTFSMRIDAGLKKALEIEARRRDRSAAYLAKLAIENLLDREEAKRQAIREALETDNGERTSGEAVMRWLSRWADGHDEPLPEPDSRSGSRNAARAE